MQLDMAQVYTDFSGLAALRAHAREDQDAALDQVSRQFESLFVQMMLKSMRDASMGGGMLDSKQSEFYREMYDKQIAIDMSEGRGIGLADVIKRQLGGGIAPAYRDLQPEDYLGMPIVAAPVSDATAVEAAGASDAATIDLDGDPGTFLQQLWPVAEQAATRLGIAPEALLAQAALETGWGRSVMRHGNGDSSHNLFGIKADERWRGDRINTSTLEYRDGVALRTSADFRAYASFEQSFSDYVDFVQRNPRYRDALGQTDDPAAYFGALQRAGYATDPAYADKIGRILEGEPMQRFRRQAGGGARDT
ncbi:MAG: flagellar assembly peptidoglycan hydrolase FlgJ [Chromatiaceae bacterium]|nr:flagellar assembly peptidoglycan hydrolase FlgJ [Gammaproteobacteria bacterium]MCP5301035.1 flagellar assembly peptidoglycan hydrolase FlgJ [Chromatiaceae bacterium]MCP5421493.1 flagellar assembly peptidoglycan hydrolase FlgJ [Chromatiaceae bacterium]